MELIDFILHVDRHLTDFVAAYGAWIYALLFLIVFVETGVVVMPLLPGDSLLFAAGALAAAGAMNPFLLTGLLIVAAVLGDSCNYAIGRYLGPRVYEMDSRWIRRDHLKKTHDFYEKYGGQTIIIARFVPIVRTFAPFVAGVGSMAYSRFMMFNVVGGVLWVTSCVWLGYGLGNLPFVKDNFSAILLLIIFVSILPGIIAWVRHKLASSAAKP
jgi:membrane-associated protein